MGRAALGPSAICTSRGRKSRKTRGQDRTPCEGRVVSSARDVRGAKSFHHAGKGDTSIRPWRSTGVRPNPRSSALENTSRIEQTARLDQRRTAINMSGGHAEWQRQRRSAQHKFHRLEREHLIEQVGTGHKVNVSPGDASNENESRISSKPIRALFRSGNMSRSTEKFDRGRSRRRPQQHGFL
jgi:hypothetical protein